jgi:hypothetical protein
MADHPGWMPTVFIAGAPKSGTSSVFRWLTDHPQAHGSAPKETCFFAEPGSHVFDPAFHVSQGIDAFRAAFHDVPPDARLILEGTATSIYSRTALDHIPDLPTRPRCLFILREPAAQILSTYTYFRNNWAAVPAGMTFADYLRVIRDRTHDFAGNELARDALDNARYVTWLGPWRDRLGPDRIKVCTFDALRRDPRAFMADLAVWAGIDPAFYDDYEFESENESYVPVSRSLQRLNIALRDRLPKGRLYDGARRLYRRLNTRAPARTADDSTMAALRAEFSEANRQLAADFGLDLSGWG